MSGLPWSKPGLLILVLVAALLVLGVSCGTSDTEEPEPTAEAAAASATEPTPVATTAPVATEAPAGSDGDAPHGTLNVGFRELGPYTGHARLASYPQWAIIQLGALEGLMTRDAERNYKAELAESWSVSEDNKVWTFKIREGVPFHKGYGELVAEDVVYSLGQCAAEGSTCGTAGSVRRVFFHDEGYTKVVDDYTVEVNTVIPAWDIFVYIAGPGASATWIFSKKQVDQEGEERMNRNGAGTGPWEIMEHRTGEFWKFNAVQDHWRKTPYFEELIFWEIPEESSRLAGFQATTLDTATSTALDSLPVLAEIPGMKFMRQELATEAHIGLYGSYYVEMEEAAGWDPEAPWVSPNPDPSSPEWERARKVREAMGIAIDRDVLVNELFQGNAEPAAMWWWLGQDQYHLPGWEWEYNPERAKELLVEAGYPDGFSLDLTPSIRNAPGEVEACEAVAAMWEDVGIRAKLNRLPFSTLVTGQFARANKGVTCHNAHPYPDPMNGFLCCHVSSARWSSGVSHPRIDELVEQAINTFDFDERMKVSQELGKWMWDNTLDIGLYNVHIVYPVGPRIDDWADHLTTADSRMITALEWTPHRE